MPSTRCFRLLLPALLAASPFPAAASGSDSAVVAAESGPRFAYYKDGEIHVNRLGTPEGEPVTTGHWDFKPSWSRTGDWLVFFRRLVNHQDVAQWKTAICVIKVDGSRFQQLTDGTHTDFNQTWTRDGSNTPIWNRRTPGTGRYRVMMSRIGGKPGEEIALTGEAYHTWAFTCLRDGRILVGASPPGLGRGYYLMTASPGSEPRFERLKCELAKKGVLARVSLSPDESRVCFEFQPGFERKVAGRTLYLADFDAGTLAISHPRAIANAEGNPAWFAYPRWTRDATGIAYHAGRKLFLYDLDSGETRQVSADEKADYRYPHGEATPK